MCGRERAYTRARTTPKPALKKGTQSAVEERQSELAGREAEIVADERDRRLASCRVLSFSPAEVCFLAEWDMPPQLAPSVRFALEGWRSLDEDRSFVPSVASSSIRHRIERASLTDDTFTPPGIGHGHSCSV
jgi:hypothetical protein